MTPKTKLKTYRDLKTVILAHIERLDEEDRLEEIAYQKELLATDKEGEILRAAFGV